jgi:hypothetical protein
MLGSTPGSSREEHGPICAHHFLVFSRDKPNLRKRKNARPLFSPSGRKKGAESGHRAEEKCMWQVLAAAERVGWRAAREQTRREMRRLFSFTLGGEGPRTKNNTRTDASAWLLPAPSRAFGTSSRIYGMRSFNSRSRVL